jgi:hypothetical protein
MLVLVSSLAMLAFAISALQSLALAVPVRVHLATDARMLGHRLTVRFGYPVNRCANRPTAAARSLMHAYPDGALTQERLAQRQGAAVTRTL